MAGSKKEAEAEKTTFVLDILKEANGQVVRSTDLISALSIKKSTFGSFMQRLKKRYPDRIGSRRGGHEGNAGYYWIPEEKGPEQVEEVAVEKSNSEEPELPDRYDDAHNDEGYSDPTAFLAMRNTGELSCKAKPGDVYYLDNKLCVVIGTHNSSVTNVPLYISIYEINEREKSQCESIVFGGKKAYVNPIRINTRPFKHYGDKAGELMDSSFRVIKAHVGKYLNLKGIGVVEKVVEKRVEVQVPVEKVVEKVVEVPVAAPTVTVEGYTFEELQGKITDAVEVAVLKERARIYEDIAMRLLPPRKID